MIPIPRDPEIDVSGVPRHWAGNNAVATAISNGINLMFPIGERFFVRSVHHYLSEITDPTLRAQVKAFFKQEGHHAHAHDELNDILRQQGFEIDRFLAFYEKVGGWLEKVMGPKLNLAGTAAAEHFTAIMADGAFSKGVLDLLHPAMQKLLAWHAAEEIEHKAVAFDVLKQVDDSYALRIAGLAYATAMMTTMWLVSSLSLIRQEKLGWRGIRAQLRAAKQGQKARGDGPVLTRVFLRGIRAYIRRDFHPNDTANYHLAREWFASHGMQFEAA